MCQSARQRLVLSSSVVVFEMVIAFCNQLLSQSGARAAKASHTHRLLSFQGAVRCKISGQSGTGSQVKRIQSAENSFFLFLGRLLYNFYALLNKVVFLFRSRPMYWLADLID